MGKRPSVSMKDVAALAQVSVGTISNVLNKPEMVAPETRRRVCRAPSSNVAGNLGFFHCPARSRPPRCRQRWSGG